MDVENKQTIDANKVMLLNQIILTNSCLTEEPKPATHRSKLLVRCKRMLRTLYVCINNTDALIYVCKNIYLYMDANMHRYIGPCIFTYTHTCINIGNSDAIVLKHLCCGFESEL